MKQLLIAAGIVLLFTDAQAQTDSSTRRRQTTKTTTRKTKTKVQRSDSTRNYRSEDMNANDPRMNTHMPQNDSMRR